MPKPQIETRSEISILREKLRNSKDMPVRDKENEAKLSAELSEAYYQAGCYWLEYVKETSPGSRPTQSHGIEDAIKNFRQSIKYNKTNKHAYFKLIETYVVIQSDNSDKNTVEERLALLYELGKVNGSSKVYLMSANTLFERKSGEKKDNHKWAISFFLEAQDSGSLDPVELKKFQGHLSKIKKSELLEAIQVLDNDDDKLRILRECFNEEKNVSPSPITSRFWQRSSLWKPDPTNEKSNLYLVHQFYLKLASQKGGIYTTQSKVKYQPTFMDAESDEVVNAALGGSPKPARSTR